MGEGARNRFHLDDKRSFELLSSKGICQVAFTQNAIPIITRLSFRVENSSVYFRAPDSAPLHRSFSQSVVALYADSIDASSQIGWSVLVVGRSKIARTNRAGILSGAEDRNLLLPRDIRLIELSVDLIRASYFDSRGLITEYENYLAEAETKANSAEQGPVIPKADHNLFHQFPALRRLE